MPATDLPDPEYLRQRLRYDAETGKLYWRGALGGREAFKAVHSKGYLCGFVAGTQMYAHRVVWAMCRNVWPLGQIDHIDGDPTNNRIDNLRDVPAPENQRNMRRSSANTSKVTGVYWDKRLQKWTAKLGVDNRSLHLGVFASFEDAVSARKTAERKYGFHKNHGRANTPD